MKTYENVLNEYIARLQLLAITLEHGTENIKMFEIAEEMKRKKIIVNYKLINYYPETYRTLNLEKYPDEYYNNVFEE